MNNLISIFWVILFLYIYFETDALVSWAKLLKLKFLKYEEYEEKSKIIMGLKYTDFILMKWDNFFAKLVSCPECSCVWINIILFMVFNESLGGWRFFAVNTIGSLLGFVFFKYLLKKLYEQSFN